MDTLIFEVGTALVLVAFAAILAAEVKVLDYSVSHYTRYVSGASCPDLDLSI